MKSIIDISVKNAKYYLTTLTIFLGLLNANAIEKRGLIIGLGDYGPDTEWYETHGDHDANSMLEKVKTIGFNNVSKLVNNQATKQNILSHINSIYDSCSKGDIVLLYFAGHGQLIVDYNGDESDGYDESLVLYNAPKYYDALYNNENHLLDDELSEIVNRFRIKLGVDGQFLLMVDAGFGWSGSAAVFPYERGGSLPLEANRETHDFEKIGLYETGIIDDLPFSMPSAGHANLFHVSANHIMGTARELNGNGILTLAITRSFENLNDSMDYEAWFKKIKWYSSKMDDIQVPLAEGNGSTVVFDLYNQTEGSDYDADYAIQDTTATTSAQEINILSNLKDRLIEEHNNSADSPDFGIL